MTSPDRKPLYPYHFVSAGLGLLVIGVTLMSALVGLTSVDDFKTGVPMRALALCVGVALIAWPALRIVKAPIVGAVVALPAVLLGGLVFVKHVAAQHSAEAGARYRAIGELCTGGAPLGAHEAPPADLEVRWMSNRTPYRYEPSSYYLDAYRSTSDGWPQDVVPDYVVCVGVEDEVVEEAEYTRQGSNSPFTMQRIQQRHRVRVIETSSGQVLGERRFAGSAPGGFPSVIRPGQDTHLIGERVSLDEMRGFVDEVLGAR